MNETIECFPIGTRVVLDGEIPALITAINISGENLTYQCVWWDERTRKSDWLVAAEIKRATSEGRTRIAMVK